MKRFLQCLFALGLFLLTAGIVQEVRLKYFQTMPKEIPSSPAVIISSPPAAPAPPISAPLLIPIISSSPAATGRGPSHKNKVWIPRQRPRGMTKVKSSIPPKLSPTAPPVAAPPPPQKADFDSKMLEKEMPKPVPAPTEIELPKVVAENGQWIGSQSGITEPLQTVFRNSESWRSFWAKAIAPYTAALRTVPEIDFSKEMIVAVFMGEEPLAGYQIRIVSAGVESQGAGKSLVVRYKNMDRFLGIFAPPFKVQPFHMLRLNSFPGKISFIQVKE